MVKFFVVIDGSLPKNGLPFTSIWFTSFPFTVIFPSSSTSTPGNCFSKSSTVASFLVLKDFTLNSKVSFLMVTGADVLIKTSSNALLLTFSLISPNSILFLFIATFCL